ncbi:hypothetical protein NP233_g2642 [Leucocoprinus birnbaumii]|uniref:Uncharacterized protein n=1 Tax=Leucocoprinus birnbaumii TaxID=56174 RepID=A0AAD5YTI4_9AGAR|nr:hypothetical protein NP233_g2642 [Leucocoprinus birnbaumii]
MDYRPPPPQGPPPPYAFVARVYRKNLRPVILAVAFIGFFWTLFASIGYFRNASLQDLGRFPKLRITYIVLGALYMAAAIIELLGLTAAGTQRIPLIRAYAYASGLSILIIAGAGLLEVVTHFTLKNDIISMCQSLITGDTIVYFGFWGPITSDEIDPSEASNLCNRYWDRDSWQDIIAFIVTTLIAMFFSSCAFAYLRQMLDPSSPANAARAPSHAHRMGDYPSHYNPAYNAGYGGPGYYGQQPPPTYGYGNDAFVPPYEPKPGYTPPEGKVGYSEDTKDPFADQHESSSSRV